MVSVLSALALVVMVGVNSLVAALMTRLFRVRLETAWGAAGFVALFVPVALTFLTIVMGSVTGPGLGSRGMVVFLLILIPLALGVTVDVFWMPAPEEVDLPANLEE
jgi:hypothetical protein